jgi:3-methyladenine DNA glycosylase AlkD
VALSDLKSLADPKRAASHQRYFKTGKGEYGESDVFLGLTVPQTRMLAKKHRAMPLNELVKLLRNRHHEARLLALQILVDQFRRADEPARKAIYTAYLANRAFINNWDLVDTSARDIVGAYLLDRSHKPLFALARSKAWNDRRIAIIATFHFISQRRFDTTLSIAEMLLEDKHDLMHKAVGWMLREMGKRDVKSLHTFLENHAHEMPRTMLRYAIEKLNKIDQANYMGRRALMQNRAALLEHKRAARPVSAKRSLKS